jgi:hypothetical protein
MQPLPASAKIVLNRMFALIRKFLGYVLPGVIRPLHILWNQVIGFFFLVLALFPLPSAIRSFNEGNMPRFLLAAVFIVIMAMFGISSFWRARKISRT